MVDNVAKRWRVLSGQNNWKNLLKPLDIELRRYLIHYGELAEVTYDTFNLDPFSRFAGTSRYSKKNLFANVGLTKGHPYRYTATKYLYATSRIGVPGAFIFKSLAKDSVCKQSNWIGYVAVATDETKKKLGRRDIVVAWRGTVLPLEWVKDFDSPLTKTSDILYYEVLDIPLPELQELKTLKVALHYFTKDEVVTHTITLPKQSTVGDVINDLKTKVELSHPNAELRLLKISNHKIYTILPLTQKIEYIGDRHWTLRAEEIPEEEKNIGPHDRFIYFYHFMNERAQNQLRVQKFGEPFCLVIHKGETLAEVKARTQKKLQVPDDEFSKRKFAFFPMGRPEYLQDSDIVSTCFQRRDVYDVVEQCLGLDHADTAPKRSYTANQEVELPRSPPTASRSESPSFDDMDAYISELVSVGENDAPFDSTTKGSAITSINPKSTIDEATKVLSKMLSQDILEIPDFAAHLAESILDLSKYCDHTSSQLAKLNNFKLEFLALLENSKTSKHYIKEVEEKMLEKQGAKKSFVEQEKINAFAFQTRRTIHKDLVSKVAKLQREVERLQAELASISEKKTSAEKEIEQLRGKMESMKQSRSSFLEEFSTLEAEKKTAKNTLSSLQQKWTELRREFMELEPNN